MNKIRTLATPSWLLPSTDNPVSQATFRQIIAALADPANPAGASRYPDMVNAISPLADNDGATQWLSAEGVSVGDDLYLLIQATTSWTDPQMTTFMNLAATKKA